MTTADASRSGLAGPGTGRVARPGVQVRDRADARSHAAGGGIALDVAEIAGPGFGDSAGEVSLSERLTAVARLIQIGSVRGGPGGFSAELLQRSEDLLARVGERLRMSPAHTVVVLAGGTGSGKSSLFNRLAGADFSPVGVVRPMTREPRACVWGMEGAGPLLDWLGVERRNRYARSSALDEGERSLVGLLLLDLPDHDSVLAGTSGEVSRLVGLADLMVWVLDPQKYADASVHNRYLVPMAGHSEVITVALNQSDLLATPRQADDCVSDLRRLLDGEGLHDARVIVTSAVTGEGIDELRKLLVETVTARQAAADRIAADVDALVDRFAVHATVTGGQFPGPDGHPAPGAADGAATGGGRTGEGPAVPGPAEEALTDAFARAAGVSGVGRALQSARELRAVDYVGWPVSWLADRLLRRDPVRRMRLGNLWNELRGVSAGPAGAQEAEIDNAVTVLADDMGAGLPSPWPDTVREAARSRMDGVPAALGAAVAGCLPAENSVSLWWRMVAAWQGLLLGGVVTGLAWLGTLVAVGVFHLAAHTAAIFGDVMLLPWVGLLVAAVLAFGWLTAVGCMTLVVRSAARERGTIQRAMRGAVAGVARQMVMIPVEQELSEYERFCDVLAIARGEG